MAGVVSRKHILQSDRPNHRVVRMAVSFGPTGEAREAMYVSLPREPWLPSVAEEEAVKERPQKSVATNRGARHTAAFSSWRKKDGEE